MSFSLMRARDPQAAIAEATDKGVHITQLLGDSLVEVLADSDFDLTALASLEPVDQDALTDQDKLFFQAWHAPQKPIHIEPAAHEHARCGGVRRLQGFEAVQAPAPGGFSASLTGIVAIKVYAVSIGSGPQAFSFDDTIALLQRINGDNQNVQQQLRAVSPASLTFAMSLDVPVIDIPVEGGEIDTTAAITATCQTYGLNFQDADQVANYIKAFAKRSNATGGGMMLAVKPELSDGNRGLAYYYPGLAIVTTAHTAAPIPGLYLHEMLHLFGAADEYLRTSSFEPAGAYAVPNCNTMTRPKPVPSCCEVPEVSCIMRNELDQRMCDWTKKQVGWSGWLQIPNSSDNPVTQISCGNDGSLWAINSLGGLMRADAPGQWDNPVWIDQALITAISQVVAYDSDTYFMLDEDGGAYLGNTSGRLVKLQGAIDHQFLSVSPVTISGNTRLIAVEANGGLYEWPVSFANPSKGDWTKIPLGGSFKSLACARNIGLTWLVGGNDQLYFTDPKFSALKGLGGTVTQVAVSPDAQTAYAINAGYKPDDVWAVSPKGFRMVPGYLSSITIGAGTAENNWRPNFWGLSDSNLYRRVILATP